MTFRLLCRPRNLQTRFSPRLQPANVVVAPAAAAAADADAVHDAVPTTPHQILAACGLMSWQAPAKDSDVLRSWSSS